jgi:amino acid transporter
MSSNRTDSSPGLKREAGVIGLLYASLGAIIGSGWLKGPLNAAVHAGPLSLFSWIIGGVAILLLAIVYAELATLFPRAGAVVHFPRLTHGSLLARIWSWILFLAYVSVAPAEVVASLNYLDVLVKRLSLHWIPPFIYRSAGGANLLTGTGMIIAIVMLGAFTLLNFLGIKWAMRISNTAGWWKLAVPLLTAIMLLAVGHHWQNFHINPAESRSQVEGIFTSLSTAGVLFSFLGFRQAVELAGESTNPKRNIPIAVVGSVLIGLLIYLLLQAGFIASVDPHTLAQTGWAKITTAGYLAQFGAAPLAAAAQALGLIWLTYILYVDAVISPGGTGFIYITTSARVISAMGSDHLIHKVFSKLNRNGVPWVACVLAFLVGIIFLLPLPSWSQLVGYISSVSVLSYGIGPVVLLSLRKMRPESEYPRPFRLPAARILAPITFIISNLMIYWSGLKTLEVLMIALAVIFLAFIAWRLLNGRLLGELAWRSTWWVAPYLLGLVLLDYIGPHHLVGGINLIPFPYDTLVVAAFSLGIFYLAVHSSVSIEELETYIATQEL